MEFKSAKNTIWVPHPGSQVHFLRCPADEALLHGNRGGGKAQPLDSMVLTPRGFRRMGDLEVGNKVCNPDGTISTIIGVYPQGKKKIYKVIFHDGSVVHCCGEHLWFGKVAGANKSRYKDKIYSPLDFNGYIYTTNQLFSKFELGCRDFLIPCPDPIKYSGTMRKNRNVRISTIDPYLLGVLLGDGCICRDVMAITTTDSEISDYISQFGFYNTVEIKDGEKIFSSNVSVSNENYILKSDELYSEIEYLGLRNCKSDTKFIPKQFLFGTVEERTAILQGLMDTDGEAKEGKATFSSTSWELIQNVRTLIWSLGGWSTVTGGGRARYKLEDGTYKDCKPAWGLYIRMPAGFTLFKLTRKQSVYEQGEYMHGRLVRKVVAIVENGEEEVQCIKVNNPNGLYITDDFVVTHNTDCLLMDFLQHVGVGYGMEWRGVLFREEYTQLTDVINKSKKWISQIFPGAKYNGSEHKWTFPEGETLYLRYMRVPGDYWAYHGHEYPWIGWEELTNWATDECYLAMMSCNRCSDPNVPRKYRSTCNPSGPGHSWVKHRFIEPIPPLKILKDPNSGKTRAHINSKLEENKTFLDADPRYQQTIIEATKDDPAKYKAWVLGSWDIVTGGFFYDVWDRDIHVLPYFQIPASWRFYRSFDWGSTKPWAVTYIAESNGEQPIGYPNLPYFPTGTAVVFQELYGWNGKPNEGDPEKATSYEIADRVLGMDRAIEREFRTKVFPGPADNSIYDVRDGASIGSTMRTFGLHWRPSYKGPGSRISGWALIRTMLGAAKRKDLENPHLYFCEPARHHIRTLPLMQHDKGKPEDIDTNLEDHCMDSLRYGLAKKLTAVHHKSVRY